MFSTPRPRRDPPVVLLAPAVGSTVVVYLDSTRLEASAMRVLYVVFVAWTFTEVFGVTTLLQ